MYKFLEAILTFGHFNKYREELNNSLKQTDEEAIRSDWEAVGAYLRAAMRDFDEMFPEVKAGKDKKFNNNKN